MFKRDRTSIPENWMPIHPSVIKNPQRSEKSNRIPLHIPAPPMVDPSDHRPCSEKGNIDFDISTTYSV